MTDIDICIITKLKDDIFFELIESIIQCTHYETLDRCNFFVCYTGEKEDEIEKIENIFLKFRLNHKIIKDNYNFSRNNNRLSKMGNAPTLLFLNDDMKLKTDAISHTNYILSQVNEAGTIGIKLLYPDHTIQHAGQSLYISKGKSYFIGVTHYGLKRNDCQIPDIAVMGNTGAFLMLRRSDFEEIGGFDEGYDKCFEDVQMNLQMLMKGKINICCCSQSAYHFESTTRKQGITKGDVNKLASFFNNNKEKILQRKDDLSRTILEW